MQTAKCVLHSHPILPCPILMINAVASQVEARQRLASAPVVGLALPHGKAADWTQALHASAFAAKVQ